MMKDQRRATDTAHGTGSAAWQSRRAWGLLLGTAAASLVVDLLSKYWAFATIAGAPVIVRREEVLAATPQLWKVIPPHQARTIVPGILDFTLVLNPGAVFGVGAGKRWFFVVVTFIAVSACVVAFAKLTRGRDWFMHVAFGLIIGAGLGNLYDRVLYACVRDFIHPLPGVKLPLGLSWPWGGREVWPYVSNIADALLIVGVAMLMWQLLKPQAHPPSRTQAGSPA